VFFDVVGLEFKRLLLEHFVDAFQGAYDPSSFLEGIVGIATLLREVEFVAGDAYDQIVAKFSGPLQYPEVPVMENIERSKCDSAFHVEDSTTMQMEGKRLQTEQRREGAFNQMRGVGDGTAEHAEFQADNGQDAWQPREVAKLVKSVRLDIA